ncbi:MAG TPA: AAA family ATPase, partial [Chthoniobacteraceae bacterium]
LAQALLPAPRVVLLDEPTEGLDPEGIHEIRSLIQKLNRERGLTVLFSSHLLSEVEQLCNRIAIINQGRLLFVGRWSELQGKANRYRLEVDDWTHVGAVAEKMHAKIVAEGIVEISANDDIADFVAALVWDGIKVRAVEPQRANLEELYLQAVSGNGTSTSLPGAAVGGAEPKGP